jgi:Cu-Zn family superoxide dismutase
MDEDQEARQNAAHMHPNSFYPLGSAASGAGTGLAPPFDREMSMMKRSIVIAAALMAAFVDTRAAGEVGARAILETAHGKGAGEALLAETPHGILMTLTVEGMPAGTHALHVHEKGQCAPPSFESAGGHFAPGGTVHGLHSPKGPHAGDLPNLHMRGARQTFELILPGLTLETGPKSLMDQDGSAVVIHAAADDYRTDPAGNAGARIACGVVKATSTAR